MINFIQICIKFNNVKHKKKNALVNLLYSLIVIKYNFKFCKCINPNNYYNKVVHKN